MLDGIIEKSHIYAKWLSSRANRLRLRGARIEVLSFVITRNPSPAVLLVESSFSKAWMPPQEGVCLAESFHDAFYRCIHDECGIDIPQAVSDRRRLFYLRHIEYLGLVELPRERHGERLVADDAVDTPLSSIKLTKKAYWAAIAIVKNSSVFDPKPDGREVIDAGWFDFEKARELMSASNKPSKGVILLKGLDTCKKHL